MLLKPTMTLLKRYAGLLAISFLGLAQPVSLRRVYHDSRTGLTIHFPENWNIDRYAAAFRVLSFNPEKSVPQMIVPENQAAITILEAPPGISSATSWLESERVTPVNGYVLSEGEFSTAHFGRIHVITAKRQPNVDADSTLLIEVFMLGGRLKKTTLLYRSRGQIQADHFEEVLKQMIKNLE